MSIHIKVLETQRHSTSMSLQKYKSDPALYFHSLSAWLFHLPCSARFFQASSVCLHKHKLVLSLHILLEMNILGTTTLSSWTVTGTGSWGVIIAEVLGISWVSAGMILIVAPIGGRTLIGVVAIASSGTEILITGRWWGLWIGRWRAVSRCACSGVFLLERLRARLGMALYYRIEIRAWRFWRILGFWIRSLLFLLVVYLVIHRRCLYPSACPAQTRFGRRHDIGTVTGLSVAIASFIVSFGAHP